MFNILHLNRQPDVARSGQKDIWRHAVGPAEIRGLFNYRQERTVFSVTEVVELRTAKIRLTQLKFNQHLFTVCH